MAENIVEVVLRVNADQFKNGINNATRVYAQSTKNMTGASGQAVGGVQNLTSTVLRLGAAYISVSQSIRLVKTLLETGGNFEQLRVQLETLTGSAQAGEAAFAWINDFVKETPFGLEDVTKGFIKLKAFGLDPMDGTYQVIADQAAALGGGQEKLNGIIIAVGQAWAKQKLQAEEILQLVERGVPVWDLLAKVTGKNAAELNKLSEQGKLGRDVIRDLLKEMGKGVDGAALAQVKTWNGLVSNASVEWQVFLDTIAQTGALDVFKSELTDLLKEIDRLRESGELKQYAIETSEAIVGLYRTIKSAAEVIYEMGGAIKLLVGFLVIGKIVGAATGMASLAKATWAANTATGAFNLTLKTRNALLTFGATALIEALIVAYKAYVDAVEKREKRVIASWNKERDEKAKILKALTKQQIDFAAKMKKAKELETAVIGTELSKQQKLYENHLKSLKETQEKQQDIAKEFADFVTELGGAEEAETPNILDYAGAITKARNALNEGDYDGAIEGARGVSDMLRTMRDNGTLADDVLKGLGKRVEKVANEAASKLVEGEQKKLEDSQAVIDGLLKKIEKVESIEIGFDQELAIHNAEELHKLLQETLNKTPLKYPVSIDSPRWKPEDILKYMSGKQSEAANPLIPENPKLPAKTATINWSVNVDSSAAERKIVALQKMAEQPAVKPVKVLVRNGNSFSDSASSFGEGDIRREALKRGKR